MVRSLLVTEINISELIDMRIDWHLYYPSYTLLLSTRLQRLGPFPHLYRWYANMKILHQLQGYGLHLLLWCNISIICFSLFEEDNRLYIE